MTKAKAEKEHVTHPAKKADSYGCECGEATATPFDVCPRCGTDELKRIKKG